MPDKNTVPLLSPKFSLALQFANEIHSTQVRKGMGAPYISHLMAVSALVLEFGGNETQAIAALLHDSAEDCGGRPMLDTVRVMFGEGVADIVEACTDSFDVGEKSDWKPRKETYLKTMARPNWLPAPTNCIT
jgi:(p)ppGpp synthase/HD superfamily hydrolase